MAVRKKTAAKKPGEASLAHRMAMKIFGPRISNADLTAVRKFIKAGGTMASAEKARKKSP